MGEAGARDRRRAAAPMRWSATSARRKQSVAAALRAGAARRTRRSPRIRSRAPSTAGPTRASPRCSTTAGASSPRPRAPTRPRSRALVEFWEALGAQVETMDAEHHDLRARGHQPHAAPDRLHDRRHRLRSRGSHPQRGDQVLGRRLPRLHPHRRVATRRCGATCSCTTATRCSRCSHRFLDDLTALLRAIRAGDGDDDVRPVHPHPRDPPLDRRAGAGRRAARLRPQAQRWTVERPAGGSSALIAAWTRASISSRGRPGGIGSPKRNVIDPGALRARCAARPARCRPRPAPPAARAACRARQSPTAAAASRPARRACLRGRSAPSGRRPSAARASRIIPRSALAEAVAIDHDHAVAPRRPAPDRDFAPARASSRSRARRAASVSSSVSYID